MSNKQPSLRDAKDFLHSKGIKASYPRTKIYEHLLRKQRHESAVSLFNELAEDMPSLSKATVYNTLNLFVERRILKTINVDRKEISYALRTEGANAHIRCQKSGRFQEFHIDETFILQSLPQDWENARITEVQITIKAVLPEEA